MTLPRADELVTDLGAYVDAGADQTEFITDCVDQAIAFITDRLPNTAAGGEWVDGYYVAADPASPLGDDLYRREVLELGAELFYRRQAKNGVVSVNTIDGTPIRISNDPYRAAATRLSTLIPWGFA